jgi:hypothetical protein
MLKKSLGLLFLLFIFPSDFSAYSQESGHASESLNKIKDLPGVKSVQQAASRVRPGGVAPGESYLITFEQPVDHQKPDGAKFQQRVFITHAGYDKPVILNTEGYAALGPESAGELGPMIGACNVITVEHRYFGSSIPSPIDWTPSLPQLWMSAVEVSVSILICQRIFALY